MKQFKKGELVYIPSEKKKGKIISIVKGSDTPYLVEVIVSYNEETRERTTRLLTLTESQMRENNRKSNKPTPDQFYFYVKDFHEAFNHPVAKEIKSLDSERALNRSVWTGEEALVEFLHASCDNAEEFDEKFERMIEGLRKAKIKSDGMEFYTDEQERIVAQADALTDALYFIFGSFVEIGVKPFNLFKIVQMANMSKLFTDENGKKYAKYREEDGKIMKSPEFFSPEPLLHEEVLRQIERKKY